LLILAISGCRNEYYSEGDYSSVLKIDSHVHINSDKGYFEEVARQDNFILVTLNVDHSDSAGLKAQLDNAILSARNHPGKVFYGPSFLFDTAGWGTNGWSER
jgi:hypothetical protein